MWPIDRPAHWVGRRQELAALRAGAEALRQGGGAVVWVEGEPGIGKSSLVAEALELISHKIQALLVVERGQVVGIVNFHDLMRIGAF